MVAERRARPYDSPLRRRQAEITRTAVLDAAQRLFLAHGYVATTIRAVADEAGVAPETVYARFGSKRDLLRAVIERASAGPDGPTEVVDQAWVEQLTATTDPRARLALMAERTRGMLDRTAALDEVVRIAARADADLAELEAELDAQRLADVRALVRLLAQASELRLPLRDAVDVMWAVATSDLYLRLRRGRRWSAGKADALVEELLARVVLP